MILGKYNRKLKSVMVFLLVPVLITAPFPVFGEVTPIEETRDRIESISQEEMEVLEKLFLISKEIEALEVEEVKINKEITALKKQTVDIKKSIEKIQQDYDTKLAHMEQVLIYYQRGGPATYLEILLNAESFGEFLKSLNVVKDISHNTSELLASLEDGKRLLEEERQQMDVKLKELSNKQEELVHNRSEREVVLLEQEAYLSSLEEDRVLYEEQLQNLQLLWEDCKKLFMEVVSETTRIIGAGYFTLEDLNLGMGLFTLPGAIKEDTFNRILNDNSDMIETKFHFQDGMVEIEVPELHLLLQGNFMISGESAIEYQVKEGFFYELSLDELSIQALFEKGPITLDFSAITGDIDIVDFILQEVASTEGQLEFVIKLKW